MLHLALRPRSPALLPFVKTLHYHESDLPFGLERILPNGQAHLMINLAEDAFRSYTGVDCERMHRVQGAALAGPHGNATVLDTGEMQWLMAVEFRPGGAAAFFPLPLDEVANQAVGLDDLWKIEGRLLREELLYGAGPQRRLQILEIALLSHLRPERNFAVQRAVALLSRGVSVRATMASLGYLPKTFIRRFREQVGLNPKRFARVRRMQRIIRSLRETGVSAVDWCALAADYGFTDQAHLIHDFRDLTSLTPGAYKPQSPQRGNHVPVASRPADPFLQYGSSLAR